MRQPHLQSARNQRCRTDSAPHPDAVERDEFVAEKADQSGDRDQAEMIDRHRVGQSPNRFHPGDDGGQRDHRDHEEHLLAVEQALTAGLGDASLLSPLAADSLALVRLLLEQGYQVQRLQIEEHKARVWGTDITGATAGQELILFDLVRSHPGEGWSVVEQRSY